MLKLLTSAWLKHRIIVGLSLMLLSMQAFTQAIDEVVLVVDDQAITAREFSVLHLIHDPAKPYALVAPKLGERITDAIVDELLLATHAKRLDPDAKVEPAEIQAAINALARQNNLTQDQFLRRLNSQGVDIQIFRESLQQRILVRQVVAQRIARSIVVSPAEVQEYINNRPELKTQTQKKYRASHLVVPLVDGLTKKQVQSRREVIEKVRKRLLEGDGFAQVIEEVEQVQSSGNEGDLGWKSQNELPALFVEVLDKLQVGQLSQVIESGNGYHLLALMEVQSSGGLPKEYKVRHIFKGLAPKAEVSRLTETLKNLKAQILAGVDFKTVARSESQDAATASRGGELGWIKPEQIDPLFAQAILGLEVGQISDPVRTKFGLHLIQLLETRDQKGVATLEERVRQRIFSEKVDEQIQDLLNEVKQIALIEVVAQ